jgi:predicted metalloprotease with PDZ domain
MRSTNPTLHALIGALACASPVLAQAPAKSAPITSVRYEIAFDAARAVDRSVGVTMTFDVGGTAPVLLSLPAWTPGAYEISNFARRLSGFTVSGGSAGVAWDMIDPDTWRVRPAGKGTVTVRYDVRADTLDNAMAWTGDEFLMANGTNLFLYPEGADTAFTSTVTVRTEPQWRIATPMRAAAQPATFSERSYHDLVDMPFFIGRFDIDSVDVDGHWSRVASYPAGLLRGPARELFHEHIRDVMRAQSAVFGVTPWDDYTTMIVFAPGFGGGSALEHQNSHVGIYDPGFIDNPVLPLITAHEIFHAWNLSVRVY